MTQSNIERDIGTLLAKVEGIERNMQRADEHRSAVHRRMDDLVDDVGELRTDMTTVKRDLADTKEVTDEVKRWKLMGFGALAMAGIGGTALGVGLANSFEWLAKLFRGAG